jgi:hypothetical protein
MQLALDAQASVARTRDVLFEALSNLPAGVSEIFAHPVLDGDEPRGYDLNNAGLRVHDAVCLIDVTLRELIEQRGFKPIRYWPLRELQRSRPACRVR